MKSKMSLKAVVVLLGVGFGILVSFQNCAKPKETNELSYGIAQSASVLAADKDVSLINMPVLPNNYGNLTEGLEIYGNCVVNNSSRDFVLTINDRASKTDCATKCNENVVKFPGDKITCTFPGGSSNSSIETAKNYCRIVVDEQNVKIDSYQLDRASCISQCQLVGKDLDKSSGLKCEWQKRLLFFRVSDNVTPTELGSCSVIARDAKGVQVASIVYSSGTTEASCSNVVSKFKTKYLVDDVVFTFTKTEYVVIP